MFLAVPVVVGALVAGALATTASAAEFEFELDWGHIDAFTPTWVDDQLVLNLQEDVTGHHILHAPEDVLLKVKPEAALPLPDLTSTPLAFLGGPGDIVYLLPQIQDQDLIWPGWSTELIPTGVFSGPLQIQIGVDGPGEVFLWQTGGTGQTISVFADGGYDLPGTIQAITGSHVHSNWAFTEPGRYTLTVQVVGTLAAGGTETSAPATYTFDVGVVTPSTTLSISGLADRYDAGDVVTLSAVQDPVTELVDYRWFTRPSGATEWSAVEDNASDTYSFTATEDDDGRQVVVRLYDGDIEVAESAPVSITVEEDSQPPAGASQQIIVTLSEDEGALVVSVDPQDDLVDLGDFELAPTADKWTASGDLRPVTVTDTRPSAAGWTVSGQVGDFTSGANTLAARHLGWSPAVNAQPAGPAVTAGPVVPPGLTAGDGLAVSRPLAIAAPGTGFGTSVLGAALLVEAPADLLPGTYEATITFTAI
jgi:surface-anchored protein